MATRFVQAATRQYAPVYRKQMQAYQAQIPALQQLYNNLLSGLTSQQKVGNQNLLEDSGARGLLRSTIPVDAQAGLAQEILQQRGQYSAEYANQLAGINQNIGQLGIDQVGAISGLAGDLESRNLALRQFNLDRSQTNRQFRLDKQLSDRQYNLDKKAVYS